MNKLNCHKNHLAKGFTLIELLTGMTITTVVAGLALQALVNTQNSFTEDQKTIESGQKMSSVIEIIGREIRQAGELIVEERFPTIQVKARGTRGASIVTYRAISEPVFICQNYPAAVPINGFLFATDINNTPNFNVSNPSCTVAASSIINPSDTFPPTQQVGWVANRNSSPSKISSIPVSLGMIYSIGTQSAQPFIYTNESRPASLPGGSLNLRVGTVSFAPTTPITVGNTAYLVVKKEYLVCSNELKVRTNSVVEAVAGGGDADPACLAPNLTTDPTATLDTVATNIAKLDITMITRALPTTTAPDPAAETQSINGNFPIGGATPRGWRNIQGVTINVKGIDPLNRNLAALSVAERQRIEDTFSSQGSFYPRNALSTK